MCKAITRKMGAFLRFFTGGGIAAITLAPFGIYMKEKYLSDVRMINHEKIHWKQQLEMLIIFFYVWYLIEWFIKLFTTSDAYRSLSFEREAYDNDNNFDYLKERKHFAWINRIFK